MCYRRMTVQADRQHRRQQVDLGSELQYFLTEHGISCENQFLVSASAQHFCARYLSVCKNTNENTAAWAVMGLCCVCNVLLNPEKNTAEEI